MRLLIFKMILQKKFKKLQDQDEHQIDKTFLDIINSLNQIFNQLPDTTVMFDVESEESAAETRKKRQGLEILTPKQTFSRLPISLARLKAGSNFKKRKK